MIELTFMKLCSR